MPAKLLAGFQERSQKLKLAEEFNKSQYLFKNEVVPKDNFVVIKNFMKCG
jgi:hypothetical protein